MIRFIAVFCAILLGSNLPAFAAEGMVNHTAAKQAILVDYETRQVLFAKNADERMATSSMSKVMSMYLVFEALEDGRLQLDGDLKVSEKAWRKQGSKMFVEVGDSVKVEDLLRGVIVQSGNDATIVLAEGLAGSEDAFAAAMTAKAKDLGMTNTNFVNASGWPDPEHYSTAEDLEKLAYATIENYPMYYPYYAETVFSYNNIKQMNRNPLLFRNMGADGIKTGHTEDGGYGLIASGQRDGRRVILVVNGLKDKKERAQEAARLLEWGLRGFENIRLFSAGETVESAEVVMGAHDTVPLMINQDLMITVPRMDKKNLQVTAKYDGPLQAPIKAGQKVGTLEVVIPRLETIEVPLHAAADVKPLGVFAKTLSKAKLLLTGGSPDS